MVTEERIKEIIIEIIRGYPELSFQCNFKHQSDSSTQNTQTVSATDSRAELIRTMGDLILKKLLEESDLANHLSFLQANNSVKTDGKHYFYSVFLDTSFDKTYVKLQFMFQVHYENDTYTVFMPDFKIIKETIEPIQNKSDPASHPISKVMAGDNRCHSAAPIRQNAKVSDQKTLAVVPDHHKTFQRLMSLEEKLNYLNTLSLSEQYELALVNFHCAVLVLTAEKSEFEKFSAWHRKKLQDNFIKNLLSQLRQALIDGWGELNAEWLGQLDALDTYAKSVRQHLFYHPENIQHINADMLFLLTWVDPEFFSIYRSLSYLHTENVNTFILGKVGKYYDELLANYRYQQRNQPETLRRLSGFAKEIVTTVKQGLFPLGLASSLRVVQQSRFKQGEMTTRLSSQLLVYALKSQKGIRELTDLIEHKPAILYTSLNDSDENRLLSTYLLGERKLVKRLTPRGIQNLLQYDRGYTLKEPSFWESIKSRFGWSANPLSRLDANQLLQVASSAEKIGNRDQVDAIVLRCTRNLDWTSRLKYWIAGHPDYYQQLLVTPKALAIFFNIADVDQIQGFITGHTEHMAAVLNGIAEGQNCDPNYMTSLEKQKFTFLCKLIDSASNDRNLIKYIKRHADKYMYLDLPSDESKLIIGFDSNVKRAIQRRHDENTAHQTLTERVEAPRRLVEDLEENRREALKIQNIYELRLLLGGIYGKEHSIDALKAYMRKNSEVADDFEKAIPDLFDTLDQESDENKRIRSVVTQCLIFLIQGGRYRETLLALLLGWFYSKDKKSVSKTHERLKQILGHDDENILLQELLQYAYDQCIRNRNTPQLLTPITEFLQVCEFASHHTERAVWLMDYLQSKNNDIESLMYEALTLWLKELNQAISLPEAKASLKKPPLIKIYLRLFGIEKAHALFEKFLQEKQEICFELFSKDKMGQLKWLYKEKIFWKNLFLQHDRFQCIFDHESFKPLSACLISILPELLMEKLQGHQHENFCCMLQAVFKISDSVNATQLIMVIQENLEEKADELLSQILNDQVVIHKLAGIKDLGPILSILPIFWKMLFSHSFLMNKYLDSWHVHIQLSPFMTGFIEDVLNALFDENKENEKNTILIGDNATKLGFKKNGDHWLFVESHIFSHHSEKTPIDEALAKIKPTVDGNPPALGIHKEESESSPVCPTSVLPHALS